MPKKFLLIDGDSVLFKSFYGLIRAIHHFTAPNGLHTNGIYEFNMVLTRLLNKVKPDKALVAWDAGSTTFRTKMYPDYKGNRSKTPNSLKEQFKPTMELVKDHGVKNYEIKNYEADDIVGTMAYEADKAGYHTIVITGDRDYTQLCSNLTTVYISKRGISHMEKFTPTHVKKVMGITPEQIIDKKALQGDSSDNYPGVNKVGSKTADKLVKKFGSVEGIYKNIDQVSGKALKRHLVQDKDIAFMAKKLARIDRHAPLKINLSNCDYHGDDTKDLIKFYKKLNFRKFLADLPQK